MVKSRVSTLASAIRDNPLASWLILYGIWLIDLLSTAIALVGVKGDVFIEANPIAAWFFEWGVCGWIAWAIVVGLLLFLLLRLPKCFMFTAKLFIKKKKDQKKNKKIYDYLQIFVFSTLIVSESFIIAHNFYGVFQHFGF